MNGEGKSNRVDRKAAGVSLSVPQHWSSFAPIRSTGQHWQRNRKRQARRKRNAAKRLNGSCNTNSNARKLSGCGFTVSCHSER